MVMVNYFLPYRYKNVIVKGFPCQRNPAQGSVCFSRKLKWKNKHLSRLSCLGKQITSSCIRAWEELYRLTYDNYFGLGFFTPTWNPGDTITKQIEMQWSDTGWHMITISCWGFYANLKPGCNHDKAGWYAMIWLSIKCKL